MTQTVADELLSMIAEFGDAREDTSGERDDLQRHLYAEITKIIYAHVHPTWGER